ncbi:MAG: Asp23/Gls24 family envelope stress response protein [Lachnospiraceae bacterium]|nr:Asp23/Gls24 family envelope stress response protein [Lachnospiraceae bacterium]
MAKQTTTKKPKTDRSNILLSTSEKVGEIYIADDVVGKIAELAAGEVDGVSEVGPSLSGELGKKVGIKGANAGVKTDITGQNVRVSMAVCLKYDYPIQTVSHQIQSRVKSTIENMTGLTVSDVNIRITGVEV